MIKYCYLALIACVLTACSKSEPSATERHQAQILTINIFNEPPTLDPALAIDVTSFSVLGMLYEGLTRGSFVNQQEPAIAGRIELSDDGKRYTFHLRNSQWSDGKPVTAQDFEYAWKRALAPAFPAPSAYLFYVIRGAQEAKEGRLSLDAIGITATDDQTLIVDLVYPNPFFLELIKTPLFFPLPRHHVENDPDWIYKTGADFVGNGPFLLDVWSHHNELIAARNPLYWDAQAVQLKQIVMTMVEDSNTELALFENGTLDWMGQPISHPPPAESLPTLAASGRLQFAPTAATYYYSFNTLRPPFDNVKMRRAFAYAVNRQEIVSGVTQSGEHIATTILPQSLSLPDSPGFTDYNVVTAQRLFAEALQEMGLTKNEFPSITLAYNTSELHRKVAQAVQHQWRHAFDVNVELENLEWKVFIDRVFKPDMSISGFALLALYSDPHFFLQNFTQETGVGAATRWQNPRFKTLIKEAEQTYDNNTREQFLQKAEQLMLEEMPMIPLYFPGCPYLHHPNLKNFYFSPTGLLDFRYSYFDNGEHR